MALGRVAAVAAIVAAWLVVIVMLGCAVDSTDQSADEYTNEPSHLHPITEAIDAGAPDAVVDANGPDDTPHDSAITQSCTNDCDCFDDNVCTTDTCVSGGCQYDNHSGGCGSTVGTCRGSWCCTSEYTCFYAYDNDSFCNVDGG